MLASPLGQKSILAIDPGFRSGCKVVALDAQGKLLEETVIYPHEPQRRVMDAQHMVMAMCAKHELEAIAIGNGTASRETEQYIRSIEVLPKTIPVIMVSEAGASIYSASDVAREEFPEYDLTHLIPSYEYANEHPPSPVATHNKPFHFAAQTAPVYIVFADVAAVQFIPS